MGLSSSFVQRPPTGSLQTTNPLIHERAFIGTIHPTDRSLSHVSLSRQRRSVASIQTQGIFGLGGLELAIILAAGAFLIGPEQLGRFAGQLKSDLPDELKKIPEEFQKGVEEGETNARARNAKLMELPPPAEGDE